MKHLRLVILTVALAAAAAMAAVVLTARPRPRLPAVTIAERPLPAGGDFTLASQAGRFDLAAVRGRPVVLAFGYTACPDVCPTTLTTVAAALRALAPAVAAEVVPVFVSIDPGRDTVEQLARYVAFFHPALIGAVGTPTEIAAVAARYDVTYARVGAGPGYSLDHSAELHVLDRAGRPAARLPHDVAPEVLATALARVAGAATSPPPAPVVAASAPTGAGTPPAAAADRAVVVVVEDAYVRLVPAASPNTAAFMRLRNPTAAARAVVGGASPAARTVELHTHQHEDGVMRMRRVARIDVAAGGTTELAPGGLHVMMFDLVRPLVEGETVELELELDDGQRIHVAAPVRSAPASPSSPMGGHGHRP